MKFVLFKNEKYAAELAGKIDDVVVRNNEVEVKGIIPHNDDVFIIDAHYGNNMIDLYGLKIVRVIRNRCMQENLNVQFKILSWFKEDCEIVLKNSYHLSGKENVQFIQLPINDLSTLTI
jgi:hypothetical protein